VIETVQSATRVFTYDDGRGSDEHCCLVRVRDQVCLATPVTRSLLQVNKQCPILAGEKVRRPKKNNKIMNRIFLDRISRRLNIEAVREQTDHILIELQKPLDNDILNRDLVCLASTKHALNLNRCFVEIFNPIENEKMDEKISLRKFKHQRQHRSKEEKTLKLNSKIKAEDEINRVQVGRSVQIREGEGLLVRQTYRLDPHEAQPKSSFERKCWSWLRHAIKKNKKKSAPSSCLHLNDRRDRCIRQLVHQNFNESNLEIDSSSTLTVGSRLFCENHGQEKFIGHLIRTNLCFQDNHQIVIEHMFNDIANLADANKNKEILQFISEEQKLKAEFEDDCHDETTLLELNEAKVESRVRNTKKKTSSDIKA